MTTIGTEWTPNLYKTVQPTDIHRLEWLILQNGNGAYGTLLIYLKDNNTTYYSIHVDKFIKQMVLIPNQVALMKDMLRNKHAAIRIPVFFFHHLNSKEMAFCLLDHFRSQVNADDTDSTEFHGIMLGMMRNCIEMYTYRATNRIPREDVIKIVDRLYDDAILYGTHLFYNHRRIHRLFDDKSIGYCTFGNDQLHAKQRYLYHCILHNNRWLFDHILSLQDPQKCKWCNTVDQYVMLYALYACNEFPLRTYFSTNVVDRRQNMTVSYFDRTYDISDDCWLHFLYQLEQKYQLYAHVNVWNGWWYKHLQLAYDKYKSCKDYPSSKRPQLPHLDRWIEHAQLLRDSAIQQIAQHSGFQTQDIVYVSIRKLL